MWVSTKQFEQMLDAVVGRTDVRITFDDGNASDVEVALPRLLARGMHAEFFLLAGMLGQPERVDLRGIRALVDAGMSIGSHGWSHRNWRRLDDRQAVEEMHDAHRLLGEITGKEVSRVAVPFGSYDRRVLRRLRTAGVTRVYTSDGGRARAGSWLQPRNSLRHDMDAEWLARVLDTDPVVTQARNCGVRVIKRVRA
jgi:peptidoglycan/xylan/chitin deacetylase (PgdA/CDA1 family)